MDFISFIRALTFVELKWQFLTDFAHLWRNLQIRLSLREKKVSESDEIYSSYRAPGKTDGHCFFVDFASLDIIIYNCLYTVAEILNATNVWINLLVTVLCTGLKILPLSQKSYLDELSDGSGVHWTTCNQHWLVRQLLRVVVATSRCNMAICRWRCSRSSCNVLYLTFSSSDNL